MLLSKNALLSFAGKNWKSILLIAAILIAVLSIRSCANNVDRVKQLEKAAKYNGDQYSSQIKNWKDENNVLHSQVDDLFVDRFALSEQLDSISEVLSIKPKQIISYSKAASVITIDAKPHVDTFFKKIPCPSNQGDSVDVASQFDFNWSNTDSSLYVWGSVGEVSNDLHVRAIDTLKRTDYWKKKWILGAKHYYTDITHTNKDIKLIGYQGTQFRTKEKRWTIGPSATYGYPVNGMQLNKPIWFIGASIQYSILRF